MLTFKQLFTFLKRAVPLFTLILKTEHLCNAVAISISEFFVAEKEF
jgi:hypothetical protein